MLDLLSTEKIMAESAVAIAGRRDVIEVTGPDGGSYLHGQLSQDVLGLEIGQSALTLLLSPQGKVDAWIRMTRLGTERYWLDIDEGFGEAALERLNRFKLRVDTEMKLLSLPMISVRGPLAINGAETLSIVATDEIDNEVVIVPPTGAGVVGFDVLGSGATSAVEKSDLAQGNLQALETERIRLGTPAMGAELDESTIPASAGIVERSVDFTKGCYVGQELVARIDSRGVSTPRTLCGLQMAEPLSSDASDLVGSAEGLKLTLDDAEVGVVTSYQNSPTYGPVGLAYIKRGIDVPSEAAVGESEGDQPKAIEVNLTLLPIPNR